MGKGKRYGKGMMATNQEGEREQFLHWCINTRLLFQHSFRKVLLKRKLPSARRERRASESSYVPFSLSRVSSNKGYGCSQRGREGRDAGFPQIEEGGQGFSRAHPGRVRTWRVRVRWTLLHSTRRYVMSEVLLCMVCAVYVCLRRASHPCGSVPWGAWIRSSRLKAVAEATERVHQRPVLVLSPSVGELLPLCHYDYMMLLIPRSK